MPHVWLDVNLAFFELGLACTHDCFRTSSFIVFTRGPHHESSFLAASGILTPLTSNVRRLDFDSTSLRDRGHPPPFHDQQPQAAEFDFSCRWCWRGGAVPGEVSETARSLRRPRRKRIRPLLARTLETVSPWRCRM